MVTQKSLMEQIEALVNQNKGDCEIIALLSRRHDIRKWDVECVMLGVDKISRRASDRPEGWLQRRVK